MIGHWKGGFNLPSMLLAADVSSALVTADMLQPVVDAITGNTTVILPIGVTIMGILVGVGLIPRILSKFL